MEAVVEHENTLAIVRKDYREQVFDYLGKHYNDYPTKMDIPAIIDQCTILQLRALVIKINNGTEWTLQQCYPPNHLVITFAGMYCGIETDGYAHT